MPRSAIGFVLARVRRPQSRLINGFKWGVIWVPGHEWDESEKHDSHSSGETYSSEMNIYINLSEGLNPIQERELLLHEVLHACMIATGATYVVDRYIKKADVEEVMVGAVSPALLAVLHNNRGFLSWLLRVE